MDIKSLTPETLSVLRQALVRGHVDGLSEFHRQALAPLELCAKAMLRAFGLPDNQESRAAVFDSFVDARAQCFPSKPLHALGNGIAATQP